MSDETTTRELKRVRLAGLAALIVTVLVAWLMLRAWSNFFGAAFVAVGSVAVAFSLDKKVDRSGASKRTLLAFGGVMVVVGALLWGD
jgi:uncharacterized protein YjeT (DUF2065 family)